MIFKVLLLASFGAVACGESLPSYMLGTFKLEDSKNYEPFLKEIGVGWVNRKLVLGVSPKQTISQNGDEISIKIDTFLWSSTSKFKIGDTYIEDSPNGESVPTTVSFDGKVLTRKRGNKFTEHRSYKNGGNQMILELSIPGKPSATAYRYFSKV